MKKITIIILLILLAGFFVFRVKIKDYWQKLKQPELPIAVQYQNNERQEQPKTFNEQPQKTPADPPADPKPSLPATYNLDVPFTSQAPYANWEEPFKEACEEASVLMVDSYYKNQTISAEEAKEKIIKMVNWQNNNFGGHFDLTAKQTVEFIKDYLDYNKTEIINNPTVDDIKYQLSLGRPVIIPAAGQLLNNPYFTPPGPIYHMLVIKGYTESEFITNDPGTKRGEDYLYGFDVIMEALHDWQPDDIKAGAKNIIVIYPN